MSVSGIYVITDETLMPGRSHVDICRAAVVGGASLIQLRDKTASDDHLITIGQEMRRITREAGVLFIVNDRLEVALACDADGLHIGQEDCAAQKARPLLKGKILGVSVSSPEEAARAREDGADYVGYGPIYTTTTKANTGPVTGVEQIANVRSIGGLPVVAIGGISESNIGEVARAGAESASVISAVVCAEDMVEATRRLVSIWDAETVHRNRG